MKNPFKAAGSAVSGMYTAADGCDFFSPTALKIGATAVAPVIASVAFVAALFQKKVKGES